jgi:hypothetical protein
MLLAILSVATGCVDPVTYGAKPNDGVSDVPAIDKAIEVAVQTQQPVCIGEGVWDLGPPQRAGKKGPIGSIIIRQGPLIIRGAGPKTILRMSGDGQKHDWRGIHILGAHDVVLENFTIDGLSAVNTEEQTHLAEVGPDSKEILIANVTFGPMRQPTQSVGQGIGGDGLRLLGNPGHEVEDVLITHSKFVDCDRSGIGIQRALKRVAIIHSTVSGAGDQAIDFEPTGRGAVEDIAIVDVTIKKPDASQGQWALTITGNKDEANNITVADSTIEGGAVMIKNAHAVSFLRNHITHGNHGKAASIHMIRRVTDVRIVGNTITRPSTAQPGPLIRASDNNGYTPYGVLVEGNTLEQETPSPVVSSISVGGMTVHKNAIAYKGGDDSIPIVQVNAVAGDVANVRVEDNQITGKAGSVLDMQSRDHTIGAVAVHRNASKEVREALRCKGKGSYANVASDGPAGACASAARPQAAPPAAPSASPR